MVTWYFALLLFGSRWRDQYASSRRAYCTVLATGSGSALLLNEESILRLEQEDPALAIAVMKEAAKRMHGIGEGFRKNMYRSVFATAENHQQALLQAQKWFGAWTNCPREIALKLFPRYDGENYVSV